eukprot:668952-Pleurochrysis_carterae.AAC.1
MNVEENNEKFLAAEEDSRRAVQPTSKPLAPKTHKAPAERRAGIASGECERRAGIASGERLALERADR